MHSANLYLLLSFVCAVSATPSYRQEEPKGLKWSSCSDLVPGEDIPKTPRLECGTLSVPIDYSKPHGEKIELALARFKTNSTKKLGSLLFNPGGPGAPVVTAVFSLAQGRPIFGSSVMENYDIVAFDPRGVGFSHPVECDPKLWNDRVINAASDKKSFDALVKHNKALGKSCAQKTGPLINHLDTMHVAKDMELIRQALKEKKLNFLGLSYGSEIGGAYAELYPKSVGRFALDGMLDHSLPSIATAYTEASTYEATLHAFFDWCTADNSECALASVADKPKFFTSLVDKAAKKPLATECTSKGESACQSTVSAEDLLYNAQNFVLSDVAIPGQFLGWPALSLALQQASKNNATLLSTPLAATTSDGSFAGLAVGCQELKRTSSSTAEDMAALVAMSSALTPLTRGFCQSFSYLARCTGWPAPVSNPQHKLGPGIAHAPPMLLVNSQRDPSTSIVWAVGMRDQMPGSKLLVRQGAGHTSYSRKGEASQAIDKFLVTGQMPKVLSVKT